MSDCITCIRVQQQVACEVWPCVCVSLAIGEGRNGERKAGSLRGDARYATYNDALLGCTGGCSSTCASVVVDGLRRSDEPVEAGCCGWVCACGGVRAGSEMGSGSGLQRADALWRRGDAWEGGGVDGRRWTTGSVWGGGEKTESSGETEEGGLLTSRR